MQQREAILDIPKQSTRLPGGEGIWVFIFGDLLIFSLFFIVFLDYRAEDLALFRQAANTLNLTFGLFNTIVLLVSSWLIVGALKAYRNKQFAWLERFSWGGLLCGTLFLILKIFEYKEKIEAGHYVTTNDFYMFYFVLTGIHLFHVFIGLGVLVWLIYGIRNNPDKLSQTSIEAAGIFWHMVDLLWIVLFPLLYLLP